MPELPEVETMCRGIKPIVGRVIERIHAPKSKYRPIAVRPTLSTINRRLKHRAVSEVSRLGKRVLIHAGPDVLILQPKMAGLVCLESPPSRAHVRLEISFRGSEKLQLTYWDRRGLGTVELLPADLVGVRLVDGRLGPDALDITVEELVSRFAATQRAVKVVLLDQKVLAGVGNLYAAEILHSAGIHPATPASELSRRRLRKLHEAMRDILARAIAYEGSTLADGTYRNALNNPGRFQNHHLVYGRDGQACASCGQGTIQRIVQAQRSTFFCPQCQQD